MGKYLDEKRAFLRKRTLTLLKFQPEYDIIREKYEKIAFRGRTTESNQKNKTRKDFT